MLLYTIDAYLNSMKAVALSVLFVFLFTVTKAQEIKVVPKSKTDAHFMNINLSPSGLYIAANLIGVKSIYIFESFSGKEINRINAGVQAKNFFFLDENYLLVVYPFTINLIDISTNQSISEFQTEDQVFTSDFNVKNKILALSTIQNIITLNCSNNQLKLIASLPSKPLYQLSLSKDGSVLSGLKDNKIFCWQSYNLELKGSIDATTVKTFIASSDFLITIKNEPFGYEYYHFNGSLKAASKEFKEIYQTSTPRLIAVQDGFFMESYKQVVFIDSEGYQTILKTEDFYKGMRFNAAQSRIVTFGFDHITVMDPEGAVYTKISAEQLFPADMYFDLTTEKNILLLDSQIVFSASGKNINKFKLNGKYAGKAIEKDNWMIVPYADGRISVWDIKTEKQLYEVKYDHIPYLIVPDQKNQCLYLSGFSDNSVCRVDLTTGNKAIIYRDNAPVSAIAFQNDLLFLGNILGQVKVAQMQPGNAVLKYKASLFGNGISKIVALENKLMVASYGRIGYLQNNLSDSANTTLFIGHNGFIRDVFISPDKRFFISTANDKMVKLWDLKKNRLIQSYHLDSISADRLQIFDSQGFFFFGSGYLMGAITDTVSVNKFMNPVSEIVVQSPNNNAPLKMAINKEGNLLASVDNNTVKVRDLKSGFLISEFSTESKTVNGITFTTDGKMIAVAAGDAVECFDPYTGKLIRAINLDKRNRSIHDVEAYNNAIVAMNTHGWHNPLVLHKNSGLKLSEIWYNTGDKIDKQLKDFKCTPNGSLLITYGSDYLKVFEKPENPKIIFSIPLTAKGKTNRNYIDFMNISPDGKYLLYVDFTDVSVVKIVDLKTGAVLKEHKGGIGAVGKNGKYIYTVGTNRVGLRNVTNDSTSILNYTFDGNINNMVYNDQADVFAVSDTWGNIKILEGRSGNMISEISRWDQYTYNSILSADGKYILFNNRWGLYTVDLKNLKREAIPAENYPLSGVFSPASDKLYFRKGDTFYAKDLVSGRIDSIFTTTVNEDDIQSMYISIDGKMLYFSTVTNEIVFINIESKKQFWSMNKFKIKDWDGFVLRQMVFKDGRYQLLGAGIKTYDKQSGLTYISLEANDQMNYKKLSSEIKLLREGDGFEKLVFERDAKIFDVSPDGKYFSYMKNLELYIIEISTGDTVFNRDNPVSGNIVTGFFTPDKKYYIIGMDDGYTEVYDLSRKGKSFKYGESAIGLFQIKRFRANESGISYMQVAGNRLLVKGNNAFTSLFKLNNTFNKELDIDFIKNEDQIYISPSGYYYSTKNALNYIAFKRDVSIYPFEQLDSKYNRPDKVLEEMNNTDTALISLYKRAYYKRIKKLGVDTTKFKDGYIVPEAGFENVDAVAYEQKTVKLSVKFKAIDTGYQLDHFNIWINEVPLFGLKGISIRKQNSNKFDTTITINLSQGENRIEASVTNVNGTESYRMPLYVKYTAAQPIKETVHFIGIGINQFADSRRNLQWCVKDIRDLTLKLKEKYGSTIIIDTLFDQNVTLSNVQALKQKLLKTNINDKVIIAYSGHGLLSKQYDYFLSSYNVNFSNPEINGIAYDEIENLLDSIPARKKLLLLDACHSGEVDKDEMIAIQKAKNQTGNKGLIMNRGSEDEIIETKTVGLQNSFELMQSLFVNVGKGTGTTIISAAGGVQFAQERDDLENGVFTFSLLEALNKNKTIKVSELKKYVGERVEQLTKGLQKPTTRNELKDFDWEVW